MAGGNGQGRDDGFYAEVLKGIGAPVNVTTVSVLRAWARMESGTPQTKPDSASWNPFSTTLPMPGATNFNTANVKNYTSRQQGIEATIKTLNSRSGYYDVILNQLRRSNAEAALSAIVASPWSGNYHYGARRLQSGGWDYKNTNLYRTWQQINGQPPAVLPDNNTTKPDGWNFGLDLPLLPNFEIGGSGSPLDLLPDPLEGIAAPFVWVANNKARIGLGILGGLIIIVAVAMVRVGNAKELLTKVAGTASNVMPQGKVAKVAAGAAAASSGGS